MAGLDERHVLLMATSYPPAAEVGGRRALRFARGLASRGFRVTVLTLEEQFLSRVDPDLRADGQEPCRVIRTSTFAPSRRLRARRSLPSQDRPAVATTGPKGASARVGALRRRVGNLLFRKVLIPDEDILWMRPAVRAAARIHEAHPIHVVLPTLPPYSQLLVAARIARRTDAFLVPDYRDPWAADRETSQTRSGPQRPLEDVLERRALRHARLVLFNTPTAESFYRERFADLPQSKVLPNALDGFIELQGELPRDPLTWMYAGTMYGGLRSLAPLLQAMARVPEVKSRLVLIGPRFDRELDLAQELKLGDRVEWLGQLSRSETLHHLRRAHRLVAVIAPDHPFSIPAKIYDYLSTRRPMVVLANPEHAVSDVLKGIPEHRILDPTRQDLLEELLRSDRDALRDGGLSDLPRHQLRAFDAEGQMDALARWLRQL